MLTTLEKNETIPILTKEFKEYFEPTIEPHSRWNKKIDTRFKENILKEKTSYENLKQKHSITDDNLERFTTMAVAIITGVFPSWRYLFT